MRLNQISALGKGLGVGLVILLAGFPVTAAPGALPQSERRIIEQLIATIEQLTDAAFIRNGRRYDAAAAGKFLRAKWRTKEEEVVSAEAFIEKVASRSSTTGQGYRIRFADGRETALASFLQALLRERRAG